MHCGRPAPRTPTCGWCRPAPTGPSPSLAHTRRHTGNRGAGLWRRARRRRHLPDGPDVAQGRAAALLSHRFRAGPAGRAAHAHRRARHPAQPLRDDRRPLGRTCHRPGGAARHPRPQIHRRRPDAQRGDVFRRSRGLYHAARRTGAAVRACPSGRAARGRARRRRADYQSDKRGHRQGIALCPGQRGGDGARAMETPHHADPGAAGNLVDQGRHREISAGNS